MRAVIEVDGDIATIEDYKWTSKNKKLERTLNALLDPRGPSGADPAPDYHAAVEAAKQLGGKVIEYELPESEEGRVY